MDWEPLKERLEQILNATIQVVEMTSAEWEEQLANPARTAYSSSVVRDQTLFFKLLKTEQTVVVFAVDEEAVIDTERRLIELMIETCRTADQRIAGNIASEEEKLALEMREWIVRQMEKGISHTELPASFTEQASLSSLKVPILREAEDTDHKQMDYKGLKGLLETFFDTKISLIPLTEHEWLILGPESLVAESQANERGGDNEETRIESLSSICSGLYEMMVSEGIGECHLSVCEPIYPAASLIAAIIELREAIELGRAYQVGNHIHLPWELQLEKLLNAIPDADKHVFLQRVMRRSDLLSDSETLWTLEQFFLLDCNVSETAKHLYVHRNTLLYRLDKFKQETGLDVRTFRDAVLVKLALQLYKITKRK